MSALSVYGVFRAGGPWSPDVLPASVVGDSTVSSEVLEVGYCFRS